MSERMDDVRWDEMMEDLSALKERDMEALTDEAQRARDSEARLAKALEGEKELLRKVEQEFAAARADNLRHWLEYKARHEAHIRALEDRMRAEVDARVTAEEQRDEARRALDEKLDGVNETLRAIGECLVLAGAKRDGTFVEMLNDVLMRMERELAEARSELDALRARLQPEALQRVLEVAMGRTAEPTAAPRPVYSFADLSRWLLTGEEP